jgi:peptide/nickel transport system permease protein
LSSVAAPEPTPAQASTKSEAGTARSERLRLLLRTPTVLVGVVVLLFWVFCALFPGLVCPYDPIFDNQLPVSESPSRDYPFGTDTNGRDVLSRVLAGSRSVLLIAPAATLIATVFGTMLGLMTGYFRGIFDDVTSRVIDAVLSLPVIVTAILIVTAVGSTAQWVVALTIGLIMTAPISRTVRASVLAEAELDYAQAARLRGERAPYLMFQEILPNVLAPVVVEFTVRLGYAIFYVATLTFIGFGVQAPSPDWAAQINQYYTFIDPYWWMTLFPALAIASLVVSANLVADGVREVYER